MPKTPLLHPFGIAGADEAGRGPLAGPVVAAAVLLPEDFDVVELDDSKKLDATTRERLESVIKNGSRWEVERAEPEEIDQKNILHASLAAMARAIGRLNPAKVLIDGNRLPKGIMCPAEAVVKGDGKYACIAAASILAKVERDRIMTEYAQIYPEYGFERHFGYPTPEHLAALRRVGPCPIHRSSFAPVREAMGATVALKESQACLDFEA